MSLEAAEATTGGSFLTGFRSARMLLVATLLAAPLAFGAVQAWAWTALAGLASALLFLWGVGCVRQGSLKIAWSPLYLPAVLFLLLGTIQFFAHLTLDPIATRESLLKLVTDLIFFFLAGQLLAAGSENILRTFGLTVVLYAFSLALFAVLQFFSSNGLIYWVVKPAGWTFGPYVNHNHYAGLMEMLIPIAAGYVLSRPGNHPMRTLLGFALVVPIASLLLCGSRGGFISLLAEVVILGAIFLWRTPLPGRRRLAAVGGLGITTAALLFFWMDPGEISKRLWTVADIAHSPDVTLGDREVVALDSLHILRDHPWVGTGLGSFETAYPAYQSFPTDLVYDHAHNDYAEALAETGLVGGLLMVAALVMFFGLAFRKLAQRLRARRRLDSIRRGHRMLRPACAQLRGLQSPHPRQCCVVCGVGFGRYDSPYQAQAVPGSESRRGRAMKQGGGS